MCVKELSIRVRTKIVNLNFEIDANNLSNTVPYNIGKRPATMQLFPEQYIKKQTSEPNGK